MGHTEGHTEGQTEGTRRAHEGHTKGYYSKEDKNIRKKEYKKEDTIQKTSVFCADQINEPKPKPKKQAKDPEDGKRTKELIAHYCDEYKKVYEVSPMINGKAAGIMKRLQKDISVEKAKKLISTYLGMNDSFFITKAHDLSTFEGNLTKIGVKSENGKIVENNAPKSYNKYQQTQRRSGIQEY